MDLQEIKTYIESNKDNAEVKSYIGGFITSDRVDTFLNTDDGKKLLQPKLDSYHGKGLETWKTNNLSKLVDEEVKKKFPTKDPNELALENMKAEMEKMKTESSRKDLKTNAMKTLSDKKLPTDLVDYFIGADEVTTNANLTKFETILNASVTSLVAEKLKGGYTPPSEKGGVDPNSMGMKLALQAQESQKQAATTKNYFD